jgi:hypothetical protein
LILNQHLEYFTIFGGVCIKLYTSMAVTSGKICCVYDELPCLSFFSPAPELVDRDKSKELCSLLVSETCTHTEALEIKHEHIFYIALP